MATSGTPATPATPYGEVYDLGYRHYDGARLGRAHAIRALVLYSMKRGVGIKKKWTSKLIPIALYIAAFTPAVIVAGVLAIVPEGTQFGYDELNGFIEFTLLIFAAGLAPEMLCDDRRENVLILYFSRAITRIDYLLSKIAAMAVLMGTIAFGPLLLLFTAQTLLDDDPIAYFFNHLGDVGRIILFGALVSAYYAAIGLSIAAWTNRKGVATAIFIGGMIVVGVLTNNLFSALDGSFRRFLLLLSPIDLIRAINLWLFSSMDVENGSMIGDAELPGVALVGGVLVVVAISAAIMYRRYLADE